MKFKFNFKHVAFLFFAGLMVLILSAETVWRVCTVCGMQDFERSLYGQTIELISKREYDEFGTHAKWVEENGKAHKPHSWKVIKEKTTDLSLPENN